MKRVKALIFIKDREQGLLSAAEGRAKSLVPVFGGNRIIDIYVHPLIHAGLEHVTVLTGGERPDIRDYFLYRYSSSSVEIAGSQEVGSFLAQSLKLRHGERALILQAEGLLLLEWKSLLQYLVELPEGNYHVRTPKKETIGYFVADGEAVNFKAIDSEAVHDRKGKFRTHPQAEKPPTGIPPTSKPPTSKPPTSKSPGASAIDGAWENARKLLERGSKPVESRAVLFPFRTVDEYFRGHFTILRKLEEYIGFEQLHPVEEVDEKSLSNVTTTGSVKSSYIAHSCVVEGTVERSILFPHVRVGKGARVVNSIVMDHNSIGGGALLLNSVLCDNNELFSRMAPNIGENVRIGEDDETGANTLYPALIKGGMTLIGRNVEIPSRVTVSRNCYIASDVGKTDFRGKDKVRAGDSILTAEG